MAGGTTPPHGATRFIETAQGVLSYAQLAPLLAERVLAVERAIAEGAYSAEPLSPELIRRFHQRLCGDLVPDWAGRWRIADVRVGDHTPPPPFRVASLMLDYAADVNARLSSTAAGQDADLLTEHLAFAEGRLLSIHPFPDFNGRVTRLWLRELVTRLELPDVQLVPTSPGDTVEYLAALRAADASQWEPLRQIWLRRLESGLNDSLPA
jgi:CRISPR-associated endonuclease/helicase Cas3